MIAGGATMTEVLPRVEILPVKLRLRPVVNLTDEQLYEFCRINSDLLIERTGQGELVIMPPTGFETGYRDIKIAAALEAWAERDGTGVAVGSSTGFLLPNSAMRSPDTAWVRRSRLATLTREQKRKFIPLCPDFVVELRSPTDRLSTVQAKMQEYMENGAQLGWLIDPEERCVYIYQSSGHMECLESPTTISGGPLLPGFALDLQPIWETNF
jgi:Uma2 family endonuclease